jgi:membrane protein YdbS with pleckstrin-like domain
VITHVRTVVPFVRVQHVDTQRGPVERALGLASVVVYTAGSRQADVTIPGLTPERADALQERLREMAIESEPEDAV